MKTVAAILFTNARGNGLGWVDTNISELSAQELVVYCGQMRADPKVRKIELLSVTDVEFAALKFGYAAKAARLGEQRKSVKTVWA